VISGPFFYFWLHNHFCRRGELVAVAGAGGAMLLTMVKTKGFFGIG
jgi:hypothetical protein